MKHRPPEAAVLVVAAVSLASALAACEGCHPTNGPAQPGGDPSTPTVRLYIVSDLAGALEPCGCVKDQAGGLDHFAAWVESERPKAPASALVAAGPLFFMEPSLKEDHRAQDVAKAETIAASLQRLGIAALAPGKNDFAAGAPALARLGEISGAALLAANVSGTGLAPEPKGPLVREINGVKIGFIGVSAPDRGEAGAPGQAATPSAGPAFAVAPAADAVKEQAAALDGQGVKVKIVLAAVGRGEAKRLADLVPGLTAIVVGSPGGAGDANTETPPAERVGGAVIAETGNHLTTAAVLDLYVRDGSYAFADASGLEDARRRADLTRRIDELHAKVAQWDTNGTIDKADLEARRADLKKLEADRAALDVRPPPAKGSFFRYRVQDVRESLGKDPGVTDQMLAYYKKVDEANKKLFADRTPRPPAAGQPGFVGVDACTTCHSDARDVWDKTAHAHAYPTLTKQFKAVNLDCVSCHVTGYDQPGGSTVTHVEKLENVQCEVCHGPGSKHASAPTKVKMPIEKPSPEQCLTCHHPPHVHVFDAKEKMSSILGPGHGRPN